MSKHTAKLDTDKERKWIDADTYVEGGKTWWIDIHGVSHEVKADKGRKE